MSIDFKSSWTSRRPTDAINESRPGGDFCMDEKMATVVVVFKGPGRRGRKCGDPSVIGKVASCTT